MTKINWDERAELDKLAELSIKTGVALQPGQDLIITAPIEAKPIKPFQRLHHPSAKGSRVLMSIGTLLHGQGHGGRNAFFRT